MHQSRFVGCLWHGAVLAHYTAPTTAMPPFHPHSTVDARYKYFFIAHAHQIERRAAYVILEVSIQDSMVGELTEGKAWTDSPECSRTKYEGKQRHTGWPLDIKRTDARKTD